MLGLDAGSGPRSDVTRRLLAPPGGIAVTRTPVFEARGLEKVYRMGEVDVAALRGVDLDIYEGEVVVVLGPSGSGKSTLLNVLGGLDAPTAGRVHWRDHDLSLADDALLTRYRRDHVGFVFQFYNLMPSLTARENVALAAEIARNPMAPEEALGLVGLSARLDHFPSQLSGGEQQRVAIARAFAPRPVMVLADEPTANLDTENGRQAMEIMQRLNEQTGTAFIFATHDPRVVAYAKRVIRLRDGRVESNGASM